MVDPLEPAVIRTRIQICGISRTEDAAAAVAAGADAIGMVFVPGAARSCSPEVAAAIAQNLPAFVTPVGLFVDASAQTIRDTVGPMRLSTIQLHGHETPEFVSQLQEFSVLKVVHADAATLLATLSLWRRNRPANLRGIVLETPNTTGGSGQENDWQAIADAREQGGFEGLPPVILAGGLHPGNVAEVVRMLRPWAVDVSSGVDETKGRKSAARMNQFVAAVRQADQTLSTSIASS